MSDDEFEAWIQENQAAPACGSCLLLVSRLRRQASALLIESQGRVWPAAPSDAWEQLRSTRWAHQVDLDVFLERRAEIDARSRFDAINFEVDPESVRDLVEEGRDQWAHIRAARAERTAAPND